MNQYCKYDFGAIALAPHWSYQDILKYMAEFNAQRKKPVNEEQFRQAADSCRTEIEKTVKELILSYTLKPLGSDALVKDSRGDVVFFKDSAFFRPVDVVMALNKKKMPLPMEFITLLRNSLDTSEEDIKISLSKLKNNQRRRERCRAIAELLWSNKDCTIAEMARSEEIFVYGCESYIYTEEQIRKWICDLASDRSPGRRPTGKQPIEEDT